MTQPTMSSNGQRPMSSPTLESLTATRTTKLNNDKLGQWVYEQYTQMKAARTKQQMLWYVNIAFYKGNQFVEFLPKYINKLYVPPAPPYRVRQVTNKIRPIIRTEYARITSQKPSASVIPASSSDEDMFAAYAGEQVWESISHDSHLQREFGKQTFWMLLTGTGFIKTYWDQNASYGSGDTALQGNICYGAVTPFHLFVPDLREQDLQCQPFVLQAMTKPVEWVKQKYGIDNIVADVVAQDELMNDAYLSAPTSTNDAAPDQVLILEMWAKAGASSDITEDVVLTVVNGTVVSQSGFYGHGEYPYTKFEHIPSGMFYADAVIADLIPLQREYNRTKSQIIEGKNRMAKPQLRAPKGSIDPTKVTSEPGLVIEYMPGLPPPEPMPLQSIPPYVIQELDRLNGDMEDISGQHQVSRGDAPPGVTAATAISFLQEKDDSLLTHTYTSVEQGMEQIARQTLMLVGQYWDQEHLVKVVGDDGYFDAMMLQGADLKDNYDIRMEGGSSLPTSKAAKQAFIMDMMKMGFIDPNQGLKLLDIGGVQQLYQRLKTDESQAQRENIRLKNITPDQLMQHQQGYEAAQQQGDASTMDQQTGQPLEQPPVVTVNTWDNHDVHITTHNNYRKSQAFELLPDEIKAEFEKHVQMHLYAVGEAMQQVQMFQSGMGGQVPPDAVHQMTGGTDPNAANTPPDPNDPNAAATMPGGFNG